MCTINEDHMMYDSCNIRCDRQNFLSFWTIFCTLNLSNLSKPVTFVSYKRKSII